MRDKQVWFPFDVYKADRKTLIPKETWTSIPVGQVQTTFYLPVWVDEGNYDVLFRTIAENSPPSFTSQMNANLDLTHHVATQVVPVEVIGRVYDFRITDIATLIGRPYFAENEEVQRRLATLIGWGRRASTAQHGVISLLTCYRFDRGPSGCR